MKLATVLLVVGLFSVDAFARRGSVPAERVETTRQLERLTKGNNSQAIVVPQAARNQVSQIVNMRKQTDRLLEGCKTDCEVPGIFADIAMNGGKKRDLSADSMANVNAASTRAVEIMFTRGVSAEKAQALALEEQGLNVERIRENCK